MSPSMTDACSYTLTTASLDGIIICTVTLVYLPFVERFSDGTCLGNNFFTASSCPAGTMNLKT